MKVIKPSWEIINEPNWDEAILQLEKAMRMCYKSEDKIVDESAEKLIRNIIARGHESTLEHISMSVKFICDRGISHELVRHRHFSFSQESTRYVKYDGVMEFILPCWVSSDEYSRNHAEAEWGCSMKTCESQYKYLLELGWSPQQARTVLPNSLKTELVMTGNIRSWRQFFSLRCDKAAHPQMRELTIPLYEYLRERCPILFDSVEYD
jgi:thymidylate synthase (FAD)